MKTSKKSAFTLVELICAMGIIILLIGFLLNYQTQSLEQAKIAQTKYILKKTAEAIRAFEADWGELPETLEYLVSPQKLRYLAEVKGLPSKNYKPYWTEQFNENSLIITWSQDPEAGWKDKPMDPSQRRGFVGNYTDLKWVYMEWKKLVEYIPPEIGGVGETQHDMRTRKYYWFPICDAWGNPILYFKKCRYKSTSGGATWNYDWNIERHGGFMLFSAGPDESISMPSHSNEKTFASSKGGKASHNFKWFCYNYNYQRWFNNQWSLLPIYTSIPAYNKDHPLNVDNIYYEGSEKTSTWTP